MAEVAPDLDETMMELSNVGKTIDGDGFTYFKLDCVDKNVGSIDILASYTHLRQVDLSKNSIRDVTPLVDVPHILSLNLSVNNIENVDPWISGVLNHLLYLDLTGNKLTALPPLSMPALKRASFAKNQITTCEAFTGHDKLESLDLSENCLEALIGIGNMPRLQTLNVGSNALKSVSDVDGLPALHTLNLSKNKFEQLTGAWDKMKNLQTLTLSGNDIKAAKALEPISTLQKLRNVEVAPNPLTEEDGVNIKLEVLIFNFGVKLIDGEEVEDDDRQKAKELNEERLEAERQRKLEEEEARKAAEEAAAEG